MRILVLLYLLCLATVAGAQGDPAGRKNYLPAEQQMALDWGDHQDVIVVFKHEAVTAEAEQARRTRGLSHNDQDFLDSKAQVFELIKRRALFRQLGDELEERKAYSHLPLSKIRIKNARALTRLTANPDVEAIYPDTPQVAFLSQTLPFIHQPQAAASGYLGAGTSVAVIDTGVNYADAAFGCTSPGVPAGCRVVYAQDFAASDGLPDAHGHGTNVAAIVAGVAPGTKIIALDVFTGSYAYTSDIISAINWVIANKATYNIVAANFSLGSGAYSTLVTQSAFYAPVSNLRAAGIVPVAASGNSAYTSQLSVPAAISGMVSVGAVYDSNIGYLGYGACTDATTAADKVTCFSNSASFLTLLAPGAQVSAGGYTFFGTSQAAPHVAGAVAVLKGAFPGDSVDQTVTRLQNGPSTTDARNGIAKPRVDLAASLALDLQAPSVPTGVTAVLASPTQVDLSWLSASDNVAVVKYQIFRDTVLVATRGAGVTTYNDPGLIPSTSYGYQVSACDAAGNCSAPSTVVSISTPAPVLGTVTTVASSRNPATFGSSVTFTATVSGGSNPGGTVTFKDGAATLGNSPLSGGVAALSVSNLSVGLHDISAAYSGDVNNLASTSAALVQAVVVDQVVTLTTLVSSRNPATFGSTVTFTATVSGGNNPSGMVTFKNGAATLGISPLSGGVATLSLANLGVGVHYIGAAYSGDAGNAASSANVLSQVINAGGAGASPGLIAGGREHTCVTRSGGAQCWGSNGQGQLGNGGYASSPRGVSPISAGAGVTAVAAGSVHSCAVVNGGVKCWGNNGQGGALGNNELFTSSTTPVTALPAGSGATMVVAGGTASGLGHTCAIVNGGVQCWGENSSGQVGNNTTTNSPVPVWVIPAGSGVTALVLGGQHSCAIANGGLRCWGENADGQLGNGSTVNSLVPISAYAPGSGVTYAAAGYGHTCVVANGGVRCWGAGGWGQLGNGSFSDSLAPVVAIPEGSGATAVVAQWGHTCAVVADEIKCWGANTFGQLGYTDGAGRSAVPVAIAVLANASGVIGIAAGQQHTCVVITGGVTQCWGLNNAGQLGNGGFASSLVPVSVIFEGGSPAFTATNLTSLSNPSSAGSSVTFTATVTGGNNPTGLVTFYDGVAGLGSAVVNSAGTAVLSTSALSIGNHNLTAVYGGDANNLPSTSGVLVQTVNASLASTSTGLSVVPGGTVAYGTTVTLTGTVTGGNNPGGSIIFSDALSFFGISALSSGVAAISSNALSPRAYSFTAAYGGDANNAASTSSAVVLNVVKANPSSISLFSPVTQITVGSVVTLSTTVTGTGGAFPTGSVTFKAGATTLGTGTIPGGALFFGIGGLATGSHTITAIYSGDANYNPATSSPVVVTVVATAGASVRADLNGDGKSDVLWRNTTTGENYLYIMNGLTVASGGYLPTVPTAWSVAGMGNFDGDTKADILWRNGTTGENYLYFMNGTTVTSGGYLPTVPLAWIVAGTGDFNGDGKTDILWRNTTTGENYVYFMNGLTVTSGGYLPSVPTTWTVAGVNDLDGDNKADILWRNTSTGENYVYLMNGLTVTTGGYLPTVPLAWTVAGMGDFNGDTKADILWRNTTTGENYAYFMNGLTVNSGGYLPSVPTAWAVVGTGDHDGDGKADILWRNTTTGDDYLYIMNGLTVSSGGYLPNVPTNWVVTKQ